MQSTAISGVSWFWRKRRVEGLARVGSAVSWLWPRRKTGRDRRVGSAAIRLWRRQKTGRKGGDRENGARVRVNLGGDRERPSLARERGFWAKNFAEKIRR